MSPNTIQVVALDITGTTVADDGLVIATFDAAATAAGLRAGAAVVGGTLTGAHDEHRLRAAGAEYSVDSVTDFVGLVLQQV